MRRKDQSKEEKARPMAAIKKKEFSFVVQYGISVYKHHVMELFNMESGEIQDLYIFKQAHVTRVVELACT